MEERFKRHIERLRGIIWRFSTEPEAAAGELEAEKQALEADSKDKDELLSAAAYNALATIRTSPEQEKPDGQLIEAISDAISELEAILEYAADKGK